MSEGDFFSDQAKRATRTSVENAEAQTCAEIVVAVRKSSARYGVLAYHFGLGLAGLVVVYLLLVPREYSAFAIALDGIVAFALGALLAANLDTLKRALSRAATLDENVSRLLRPRHFSHLGAARFARVRVDVRAPLRGIDGYRYRASSARADLGRLAIRLGGRGQTPRSGGISACDCGARFSAVYPSSSHRG
jgi:hypothetical protein